MTGRRTAKRPDAIAIHPYNGILLVDKPQGLTSHDVVLTLRRIFPEGVKIGHSGTLDPMAGGLLILLVGSATKTAPLYQKLPKIYRGRIRLGLETDTGDLDGKTLRESPVPSVDGESLRAAMARYVGPLEMPPPAYSAVKYKGKPLYAYARKGIAVPMKNRTCSIYAWDLLDWTAPELEFRLCCSHGTYARSLAVLLGETLACAAVLSALRRESVGAYSIADAISLDEARKTSLHALAQRLRPAVIAQDSMDVANACR